MNEEHDDVGGGGDRAHGEQPGASVNSAGASDAPSALPATQTAAPVRHAPHNIHDLANAARPVVGTVGMAGLRFTGFAAAVATGVASEAIRRVRPRFGAAARRWRNREAARRARLRALNRESLPNLFDIHPEARLASRRELGLQAIPVSEIRGTAVEGPVQRGRDFLPPPALRTQNWVARWQRIRKAVDRLAVLPPIEVLKADGAYWVVDGHNRVAAALYANQIAIDALVTGVRLPGDPIETPGSLASMLGQVDELDGVGRFVPRASFERPSPGGSAAETGVVRGASEEGSDTERAQPKPRVEEERPGGGVDESTEPG